jgi:hypothetical protein
MRHSDPPKDKILQKNPLFLLRRSRPAALAGLALAAKAAAGHEPGPGTTGTTLHRCGSDGRLSAELHGGLAVSLEWGADDLQCAGMPRPEAEGARLRLSGPVDDAPDAQMIAIILGIPDLVEGGFGRELPTNVTLIEEGVGRFFSTPDLTGCWTDIDRHEIAGDANPSIYRVSGTVYCVSPLAEVNGGSSISFTELNFTSRLDWALPQ